MTDSDYSSEADVTRIEVSNFDPWDAKKIQYGIRPLGNVSYMIPHTVYEEKKDDDLVTSDNIEFFAISNRSSGSDDINTRTSDVIMTDHSSSTGHGSGVKDSSPPDYGHSIYPAGSVIATVDNHGCKMVESKDDLHAQSTSELEEMKRKPNDNIELATCACILNIVCGIVALVFALRSREAYAKGDRKKAKKLGVAALMCSLLTLMVVAVIIFVALWFTVLQPDILEE